jgi:hypothetical protein
MISVEAEDVTDSYIFLNVTINDQNNIYKFHMILENLKYIMINETCECKTITDVYKDNKIDLGFMQIMTDNILFDHFSERECQPSFYISIKTNNGQQLIDSFVSMINSVLGLLSYEDLFKMSEEDVNKLLNSSDI